MGWVILSPYPDLPGPPEPTSRGYGQEGMETYCSDGQPYLQVAEHNDAEWDDTACDHEDNHVRLHPRVRAAAEHVWAAGSLQAMGPVPGEKGWQPILVQAGQPGPHHHPSSGMPLT